MNVKSKDIIQQPKQKRSPTKEQQLDRWQTPQQLQQNPEDHGIIILKFWEKTVDTLEFYIDCPVIYKKTLNTESLPHTNCISETITKICTSERSKMITETGFEKNLKGIVRMCVKLSKHGL